MSVRPFTIAVPASDLEDLEDRLKKIRLPEILERNDWDRGINGKYLLEVIDYWKNTYDWRKTEKELNSLHHFKTSISGIDVHFIHERGKGPNSTPIILTHGWPDSFLRYTNIIPMLTDPARFGRDSKDSFDVVIPSLPGFGFSGYSCETSINKETIADMWLELMKNRLGYQKFIAAGGDIGSGVTRYLSFKYPQHLLGIHLTDVNVIRELIEATDAKELSSENRLYVEEANSWLHNEAGYMNIQETKPQTLAIGLSDSPVGLAAWILEKFHSWRDPNSKLSLEEILTNISIYWFNNNISTAARIYYENSHFLHPIGRTDVPTGFCLFHADMLLPPKEWAENHFNVIHWANVSNGGHFTSMENPEEYTESLFAFHRRLDQL
ncbi:LAFE_0C07690g1_1 [Lachancea fermentati]|uniref:LAFE_0C07690g1_1 n=1 Tax=Lachancea fermentati TaxID=4955 RepID=A0A1G4M9R6_LACFM|nr:LAFE_0C07690g1_1 [Lachancea fermentati]